MQNHVKTLAILYIALSSLGLLAALIMLAIGGSITGLVATTSQEPDAAVAAPIVGVVFGIITVIIAVVSIPGIIAGIGLLQFKEWARVLTLVLSAIQILNVPFGTALAIYGFWVLLSNQTVALFAARRGVAPQRAF